MCTRTSSWTSSTTPFRPDRLERAMPTPRSLCAGIALTLLVIGSGAAPVPAGPVDVREVAAPPQPAPLALTLPNKADSLKFAAFGDFVTGNRQQYAQADVMA